MTSLRSGRCLKLMVLISARFSRFSSRDSVLTWSCRCLNPCQARARTATQAISPMKAATQHSNTLTSIQLLGITKASKAPDMTPMNSEENSRVKKSVLKKSHGLCAETLDPLSSTTEVWVLASRAASVSQLSSMRCQVISCGENADGFALLTEHPCIESDHHAVVAQGHAAPPTGSGCTARILHGYRCAQPILRTLPGPAIRLRGDRRPRCARRTLQGHATGSGIHGALQAVRRVRASRYLSAVFCATSAGTAGAGGSLFQPVDSSQSRTNCLSKLGGFLPST